MRTELEINLQRAELEEGSALQPDPARLRAAIDEIVSWVEASFVEHALGFQTACDYWPEGEEKKETLEAIEPELPMLRRRIERYLDRLEALLEGKEEKEYVTLLRSAATVSESKATEFGMKLGLLLGSRLAGTSGPTLHDLGRQIERVVFSTYSRLGDFNRKSLKDLEARVAAERSESIANLIRARKEGIR